MPSYRCSCGRGRGCLTAEQIAVVLAIIGCCMHVGTEPLTMTLIHFCLQELQYDYFLARISTWLLLPEAGNYTLQLSGDSLARLYIDGELVLEHEDEGGEEVASVSLTLVDGFRNAQLDVLEVRGKAGVSMQWILPNATNATDIPSTMFFAVKPGQMLDVEVSVAGLPATPRCLGHQKSIQIAAEPNEAELKRASSAIVFESPERVVLSTQVDMMPCGP